MILSDYIEKGCFLAVPKSVYFCSSCFYDLKEKLLNFQVYGMAVALLEHRFDYIWTEPRYEYAKKYH